MTDVRRTDRLTPLDPEEWLSRKGVKIAIYSTHDPACASGKRFVAHWFDREGHIQVAMAVGSDEEGARQRLAAFLVSQMARATVAGANPDLAAQNRARTEKARAARAANLAEARAATSNARR
jgi:hypothetical protein